MLGYARMLKNGIEQAGEEVSELYPRPVLGRFGSSMPRIRKWFAYVDKFLIFPSALRRHLHELRPNLVHVCDHSNSIYLPSLGYCPCLVTCHDIIAIGSALGHFTQTRIGFLGKKLQSRIFRDLKRADHVTCVSENSRQDLGKLAPCLTDRSNVVHSGFNQPMNPMKRADALKEIRALGMSANQRFVVHVGNDAWYKNRSGLLRIFSSFRKRFGKSVKLVLVGPPLNERQWSYAKQGGFAEDILVAHRADNELLQALYSLAIALIFPSLYEGFGWPPLEAQACGCPVVASPLGSLSEILEKGGVLIDPEDHAEYAETINRLNEDDEFRDQEIERGFSNAGRFDANKTVAEYILTYERVIESKRTTTRTSATQGRRAI